MEEDSLTIIEDSIHNILPISLILTKNYKNQRMQRIQVIVFPGGGGHSKWLYNNKLADLKTYTYK
jgi:hypothetical protein